MNDVVRGVGFSGSVSSALTLRPWLHDVAGALHRSRDWHLPQALDGVEADPGASFPVIDTGTPDTVVVNRGPIGDMAVGADGRRLMVTNYGDDSVSVIDTDTGAVVHTVVGVSEPSALAIGNRFGAGSAGCAYVATASAAFDSVAVIDMDTAAVVAVHPVASSIADLAVDPTGQRVYLARTGMPGVDVAVVDAARGQIGAVDLSTGAGSAAGCIRISPDGHQLYVAIRRPGADTVTVLDSNLNLVDSIEIGAAIRDIAVSPDGGTVFVASCDPGLGGVVDVIDTCANLSVGRVEVGPPVTQLTLSGDGSNAYLITADAVVVMCTRTYRIVATVDVAGPPSCAVASPDGHRLYVADYHGGVTVRPVTPEAAPLPASPALDQVVTTPFELEGVV